MAVPSAPSIVRMTPKQGVLAAYWTQPSNGGKTITGYEFSWTLTADTTFASASTVFLTGSGSAPYSQLAYSMTNVLAGSTYRMRVRAQNADGYSAWSAVTTATALVTHRLGMTQGALVMLADGSKVELRSTGAVTPVVTLVRTTFAGVLTTLATLPVGAGASDFAVNVAERGLALVADPAGNLYVIGRKGDIQDSVLVRYYPRTGPDTWGTPVVDSQSLPSSAYPLRQFAAVWVPGVAPTNTPSILVLTRRAGHVRTASLGYVLVDPSKIGSTTSPLAFSSGNDPSWLPAAPTSIDWHNLGTVDAVLLPGTTRVATLTNAGAVVSIVNGAISSVSKNTPGPSGIPGPWGRVIGIDASTYAVLGVYDDDAIHIEDASLLQIVFRDVATGSALNTYWPPLSDVQAGKWIRNWDAFYDSVNKAIRLYYYATDGLSVLAQYISTATYQVTPGSGVITASPAGATSYAIRAPAGAVDERKVPLHYSYKDSGGGQGLSTTNLIMGNLAPNAPALVDVDGFDATQAYTFKWSFSDPNPADVASAGGTMTSVSVSDSVQVYSAALTAGQVQLTLPANTLVNGTAYRWQVRHTDVSGLVGAYSAFDDFAVSSAGTLAITNPAADDPAGYELSSVTVVWQYTNSSGFVITSRRIRAIRTDTNAVFLDTGFVAVGSQTLGGAVVTGMPTDVRTRLEVSAIVNAPGNPTLVANRYITPSFSTPMPPTVSAVTGPSYVTVSVLNPPPTGDRPSPVRNVIERREVGEATFAYVGEAPPNGSFNDYGTGARRQYEYRAKAVTA